MLVDLWSLCLFIFKSTTTYVFDAELWKRKADVESSSDDHVGWCDENVSEGHVPALRLVNKYFNIISISSRHSRSSPDVGCYSWWWWWRCGWTEPGSKFLVKETFFFIEESKKGVKKNEPVRLGNVDLTSGMNSAEVGSEKSTFIPHS